MKGGREGDCRVHCFVGGGEGGVGGGGGGGTGKREDRATEKRHNGGDSCMRVDQLSSVNSGGGGGAGEGVGVGVLGGERRGNDAEKSA